MSKPCGDPLLALAAAALGASATTFNVNGTLQSFTVPTTGTYQILAFGAQGGTGGGGGGGGSGAGGGGLTGLTATPFSPKKSFVLVILRLQ